MDSHSNVPYSLLQETKGEEPNKEDRELSIIKSAESKASSSTFEKTFAVPCVRQEILKFLTPKEMLTALPGISKSINEDMKKETTEDNRIKLSLKRYSILNQLHHVKQQKPSCDVECCKTIYCIGAGIGTGASIFGGAFGGIKLANCIGLVAGWNSCTVNGLLAAGDITASTFSCGITPCVAACMKGCCGPGICTGACCGPQTALPVTCGVTFGCASGLSCFFSSLAAGCYVYSCLDNYKEREEELKDSRQKKLKASLVLVEQELASASNETLTNETLTPSLIVMRR